MTGQPISHYQVLEPLGQGGMGEVFKARDTRLNRLVAIKVLRGDVLSNAARKQRFIQEAQAASALNHQNIVTVHDIFQHDGIDCLVMEFVPGKTLDALIPKQGMRLNDARSVGLSEPFGDLHGDAQRFIQAHPLFWNQRVKGFAGDEFHNEAVDAVVLENIVDGDDIRMIQR